MCLKRVNKMSPLQAHDGSSSKPKRTVNQADALVVAFVKDPQIQGMYYATLIGDCYHSNCLLYSILHKYIPS